MSTDAVSLSLSDLPFVLLDDARAHGAEPARLYRDPVGIVTATAVADVAPALERLEQAHRDGLHLAGFLSYEAGFTFETKLTPSPPIGAEPLLWFGLFEGFATIEPDATGDLLRHAGQAQLGGLRPGIAYADYADRFAPIKAYIEAGDIYQANLTFQSSLSFGGDPIGLYRQLRDRAGAGNGALLGTGEHWLLSFSPELFFSLDRGRLLARPMKGTSVRGADIDQDRALARALADDPKQRAENLMIVDLLRNDLSRVSVAGSVEVERLFAVETYPTVHQLVSDISADLRPGLGAFDILRATFPCGSVTGAPKLRAMEILGEVEQGPRGIYTGSIGRIDPDGDARFNVAIRTLSIAAGANMATLGLGSGVVADSACEPEWRECLAKARFLEG